MVAMTNQTITLEAVRARCAEDRAEYAGSQADQTVRDREYLLDLIDGGI